MTHNRAQGVDRIYYSKCRANVSAMQGDMFRTGSWWTDGEYVFTSVAYAAKPDSNLLGSSLLATPEEMRSVTLMTVNTVILSITRLVLQFHIAIVPSRRVSATHTVAYYKTFSLCAIV